MTLKLKNSSCNTKSASSAHAGLHPTSSSFLRAGEQVQAVMWGSSKRPANTSAKVLTPFLLLYTSPGSCFSLSCPASLGCSDSRWALLPPCQKRGLVSSSRVCSGRTALPRHQEHVLACLCPVRPISSDLQGKSSSCKVSELWGAFPAPGWLQHNWCGCICTRRDLPSFPVFTFIAGVPQVMQTADNLGISVLISLCSIGLPRHS